MSLVPGLQIAGLFVAIAAVLTFTAWAEAWLASTAASINRRQPTPRYRLGVSSPISVTKAK